MNSALLKNLVPEKEELKNNQKSDLFIWILKFFSLADQDNALTNHTTWPGPRSVNEWIKKLWYIYTVE